MLSCTNLLQTPNQGGYDDRLTALHGAKNLPTEALLGRGKSIFSASVPREDVW